MNNLYGHPLRLLATNEEERETVEAEDNDDCENLRLIAKLQSVAPSS